MIILQSSFLFNNITIVVQLIHGCNTDLSAIDNFSADAMGQCERARARFCARGSGIIKLVLRVFNRTKLFATQYVFAPIIIGRAKL
jgi:hypothetical protein